MQRSMYSKCTCIYAIIDSEALHSWPPGSITAKSDIGDDDETCGCFQLTNLMWAFILSASAERLSAILQEHH